MTGDVIDRFSRFRQFLQCETLPRHFRAVDQLTTTARIKIEAHFCRHHFADVGAALSDHDLSERKSAFTRGLTPASASLLRAARVIGHVQRQFRRA